MGAADILAWAGEQTHLVPGRERRGGFVCHDESEDVLLVSEDGFSEDPKARAGGFLARRGEMLFVRFGWMLRDTTLMWYTFRIWHAKEEEMTLAR